MASDRPNINGLTLNEALRTLVPINVLPTETFNKFVEHIELETVPAGSELFHYGDNNEQVTYLLSGEVTLKDRHNTLMQTIRGGSERARYPLAHELPREVSVQATTDIAYVQIDMHELNKLMSDKYSVDHQIGDIRVKDIHDVHDSDWVTSALQSPVFECLPPASLQMVLGQLIKLPVKKGEVILSKGETANYYYYIRQGRCEVTRKIPDEDKPKVLAELEEGDGFGEDALIAHTKRNATITMLSDGILMRLSNADFKNLIEKPLLTPLASVDLDSYVAQGACILDVRNPSDYELTHLAKSKNIPFRQFREAISTLDPKLSYITYSNNGRRSAVAAFLLMQRGINAYYLNDKPRPLKNITTDKITEEIPGKEPFQNLDDVDTLKKSYATLQQQLHKEQQLREAAERESIKNQNIAKESREAIKKKMIQLANEQAKLQETQSGSTDYEQLTANIKELRAEKEDMQRELDAYHDRIENEAVHLNSEVEAIQKLEETRVAALKEIEQLHAEITQSSQEAEDAHHQSELETQKLISETAALAELNESRIKEEEKIAELESRQLKLEKTVGERDEVRGELNALLIQLASAKEDMNTVHKQIQTETKQLSELKEQEEKHKRIIQNNAALEQKLEQLNNAAQTAQSRTNGIQKRLKHQQSLLVKVETKTAEYQSLRENQKKMQAELDVLIAQLHSAREQLESANSDELELELNTIQTKEEVAQIKADAEQTHLKAEEDIQIKASAEQARLEAQKDIDKAKVRAKKIQLHAEAEAVRIKSELAILQKQNRDKNNDYE